MNDHHSLRCLGTLLLIVFGFTSPARSNPHVVGYERFHSGKPSAQGGAILYSELGCANCHGGSVIETPRKGPALDNLANRVQHEWIIDFLKNPQAGHEGSTMPGLTHGLNQADVEAIASYLGTIGKGKAIKPPRHANAERGSAMYHEKGCVACHTPTPDYRGPHPGAEGPDELAVPFPNLKKKYSLTSLSHFLANVSSIRTDGRMPHFELTAEDSLDIAAHLLDIQSSDPREFPGVSPWPRADKEKLNRGKALITRLNCAACHSLPGFKPDDLQPLGKKSGGCLSGSPMDSLPFYDLSGSQKESLEVFLNSEPASDDKLTFAALNCYACHSRDGIGGPTNETNPFFVGNESLGDSGRLPPPLTRIGHKLQKKWLEDVFHGKPEARSRPYLKTQMPKYPALAGQLSQWLTKIDHQPDATPLALNPGDNEAGRKLLGIHGGVNCITCHHWEDKQSLGIPGPDISALDQRLRPEWFREYLLNPAGYRPGTLMPPLWPGGKSAIPGILEGNTEKQIAAIWGFIKDGKGVPEGFPDRSSGQFELVPTDRPIIQRTFLEKTGAKAVLVGFPGDIHLAYDGLKGRPSLIWRGRFFDAYNTWYTRAAPFEKPLSDEVYEFAPSTGTSRFRGYTLDQDGNPTFLTTKGEVTIKEHFAVQADTLVRSVTWDKGDPPNVSHPEGVKIATSKSDGKTNIYLYVEMKTPTISPVAVASSDRRALWLTVLLLTITLQAQEKSYQRFEIQTASAPTSSRSKEWKPGAGIALEVSGMEWFGDTLALSIRKGEVWMIDNALSNDRDAINYRLFASGLHEPLGLLRDGKDLLVSQRAEITRLQDNDGDGVADAYLTECDGWNVSGNYHAYAYGPERDGKGNLWVTLNLGMGKLTNNKIGWRGWGGIIGKDGTFLPKSFGMRSPCGMGTNCEGEPFFSDQQGTWIPATPIYHLRPGVFYGNQESLASQNLPGAPFKLSSTPKPNQLYGKALASCPEFVPPAVWLPYNKMGRSATDIQVIDQNGKFGPYDGQLLVGEFTNSAINRVFLEKVQGQYQGACFPFLSEFPAAVVRLSFGPDGSLFAGLTNRGWSSLGNRSYGLERINYTGTTPFAIKEINARPDGFRLRFTGELDPASVDEASIQISSFTYEYSSRYGGSEMDTRKHTINGISMSEDGKAIEVKVNGLRESYVFELSTAGIKTKNGKSLEHPKAWYTLNKIPKS